MLHVVPTIFFILNFVCKDCRDIQALSYSNLDIICMHIFVHQASKSVLLSWNLLWNLIS